MYTLLSIMHISENALHKSHFCIMYSYYAPSLAFCLLLITLLQILFTMSYCILNFRRLIALNTLR